MKYSCLMMRVLCLAALFGLDLQLSQAQDVSLAARIRAYSLRMRSHRTEGRGQRPDGPRNGAPRGSENDRFRSIDGTGNNQANPDWGSVGVSLLRLAPAAYSDGASAPSGASRGSAREISNLVIAQGGSIVNDRALTDMVWQWGQFLDHDIDLTHAASPVEPLPIEVPIGDLFFDPEGEGGKTIMFFRSAYDDFTGVDDSNPRQQVNDITAFIDGSNVYGSDDETAASLRSFEGGRLRTSDGNLLPTDDGGFFLAGDVRVNEQAYLTAMHTLWMREHNRLADQLASKHDDWDDERLYQESRIRVAAQMQVITYGEFLPALLGRHNVPRYNGYNPKVNPGIANSFSTAVYRFGHSMLTSELLRLGENGQPIAAGNLSLADAFFNPQLIKDTGIDPYLRGQASQAAQEIDCRLVDDVRNFLFGDPGDGGFDLASLNIQRGRDHGLPSYNAVRVTFGLEPATSFADVSSNEDLQKELAEAYDDVSNIDVWVGGLAEDHVRGASVGELMLTAMLDQFTRLRDGDRYWYRRTLSRDEADRIERTRLSDVIKRNTDIHNIQSDVFHVSNPRDQRRKGNSRNSQGRR